MDRKLVPACNPFPLNGDVAQMLQILYPGVLRMSGFQEDFIFLDDKPGMGVPGLAALGLKGFNHDDTIIFER